MPLLFLQTYPQDLRRAPRPNVCAQSFLALRLQIGIFTTAAANQRETSWNTAIFDAKYELRAGMCAAGKNCQRVWVEFLAGLLDRIESDYRVTPPISCSVKAG